MNWGVENIKRRKRKLSENKKTQYFQNKNKKNLLKMPLKRFYMYILLASPKPN